MPIYELPVYVTSTASQTLYIEADSVEEAKEKAQEEMDCMELDFDQLLNNAETELSGECILIKDESK